MIKYTSTHLVFIKIYSKIKCFSIFIPIPIIPNILTEEDIDIVIEEIVNDKDFEKSDIEIETYERLEELKVPQEYDDGGIIIVDDLNEKKRMTHEFKRCLRDQDILIFWYSLSVKITMNYQRDPSELMETSITYSNQIISEIYKILPR